VYERTSLGLPDALRAVDAVLAAAQGEPDRPVAVAVVDPDGELVAYARMDGTGHVPRRMAIRKARTSARMGLPSGEVVSRLGSSGVVLADLDDPGLCGIPGGLPVRHGAVVVGGVGVSGRAAEEDLALARAGVDALPG
jgi:uncharacterized protein GlcG (DUF336 family)